MVILTVKNNTHLLISVLPILFEIYDNSTDQSHLVNKLFILFMSTRGQEARKREESRKIIDFVLCIITLTYSFYVLCFCFAPVLVCAPIIIIDALQYARMQAAY